MTDKVQKIRKKVEELFNHVKDSNFESDSGAFYYLKDLLDFIDSLQEEPTIPDIVDEHFYEMLGEEHVSEGLEVVSEQLAENARKHKAETSSPFFSQADYIQGVIDGSNWQMQQMMAKSIDGHATFEFYGLDSKTYGTIAHDPICLDDLGLKDTDKVKVIVIKED